MYASVPSRTSWAIAICVNVLLIDPTLNRVRTVFGFSASDRHNRRLVKHGHAISCDEWHARKGVGGGKLREVGVEDTRQFVIRHLAVHRRRLDIAGIGRAAGTANRDADRCHARRRAVVQRKGDDAARARAFTLSSSGADGP